MFCTFTIPYPNPRYRLDCTIPIVHGGHAPWCGPLGWPYAISAMQLQYLLLSAASNVALHDNHIGWIWGYVQIELPTCSKNALCICIPHGKTQWKSPWCMYLFMPWRKSPQVCEVQLVPVATVSACILWVSCPYGRRGQMMGAAVHPCPFLALWETNYKMHIETVATGTNWTSQTWGLFLRGMKIQLFNPNVCDPWNLALKWFTAETIIIRQCLFLKLHNNYLALSPASNAQQSLAFAFLLCRIVHACICLTFQSSMAI